MMLRVFMFAVLALSVACSKGPAPLQIYTSLDVNEAKNFIAAYEKASGERISFVRMSGGEALARIRSEQKNPQVAMWFGGPAAEFAVAEKEGLLESYKPTITYPLSKEHHGPNWGWSGWYMGVVGIGTNKKFLEKEGLKAPQSYADLLKPEFKGRIGLAYAYTSGTAFTILASLVELMGEEQAFQFVGQLDKQVHHYNRSGSACVTQVGLGELDVCLAFSQDILAKGIAKGYPIELTFPKEGAGYEVGGVGLIKGGKDHARAKKLIDWLYTQPAQAKIGEWHKIPIDPSIPLVESAKRARSVNLVGVDINAIGEQHEHLLARWRKVTGK